MNNKTIAGISCLILEDQSQALSFMEETLQLHFPGMELHLCTTLAAADSSYLEHRQTLLILDVNLPDGNCFEWLRKVTVQQPANFSVIFITAHAGYAIEALRFSAIDFLLKPYLPSDLINAVQKGLKNISDRSYQQQLEVFFHNHDHRSREEKKIVLKTLEEIYIVRLSDILALEADNSYTRFRLKDGNLILVSQPIKEYDHQLSPSGFMRVHQSYLVNLKHISAFKKKNNMLVLENELEIPVSQHKKTQLMTYLNEL